VVTGYRSIGEGASPRVQTDELTVCGKRYVGPAGIRMNYMSLHPHAITARLGQPVTYPAGAWNYPQAYGDFSFEQWIRPRVNGLNYGALTPWEAVSGPILYGSFFYTGQEATWFGGYNPGQQGMAAICLRDGVGFQLYTRTRVDAEATVSQAFPENMEQWFHLVANIAVGGNSELFINGQSAGTVATPLTLNASLAYLVGGSAGWGDATPAYNFPCVGAVALHNRVMTAVEVKSSFRSGTVSVLDPESDPSVTPIAVDYKDTLLLAPITYEVRGDGWEGPPGGIICNDWSCDQYLGNTAYPTPFPLLGESTVTFRGADNWPTENSWIVPNRSPGRILGARVLPCIAWGPTGLRFGYFDGR